MSEKYKNRQDLLAGLAAAEHLLDGLVNELEVRRVHVSVDDGQTLIHFTVDDYNMARVLSRKLGNRLDPLILSNYAQFQGSLTDGERTFVVGIWSNPPAQTRIDQLRAEKAEIEATLAELEAEAAA